MVKNTGYVEEIIHNVTSLPLMKVPIACPKQISITLTFSRAEPGVENFFGPLLMLYDYYFIVFIIIIIIFLQYYLGKYLILLVSAKLKKQDKFPL